MSNYHEFTKYIIRLWIQELVAAAFRMAPLRPCLKPRDPALAELAAPGLPLDFLPSHRRHRRLEILPHDGHEPGVPALRKGASFSARAPRAHTCQPMVRRQDWKALDAARRG